MNLPSLLIASLAASPSFSLQEVTEIINASGDGSGTFTEPTGVAVGSDGTVYVTMFPNAVFRVSKDGSIDRIFDVFGDGMGNIAINPNKVATTPSGEVYVTCSGSDNAFVIKPTGRISQIIDAAGTGPGGTLQAPGDIFVDAASNVLVAGVFSHNVFRIAPDGAVTELLNSSGDGNGNLLIGPFGLASDVNGDVFVGGLGSSNVFRVSQSGLVSVILDGTGDGLGHTLVGARDIALDSSGNLFVASRGTDVVFRVTAAGAISVALDVTGDGRTRLSEPWALAVDSLDYLYVVSRANNALFRVTPSGGVARILDRTDNSSGLAIQGMSDVAVDPSGTVYVTGVLTNNVLKVCSEYAIGTNYCSPSPNSVGAGATIAATGDESVSSRCLTLRASSAPNDTPGLFYFGMAPLAGTPFGDGLRCVGGATIRVFPFVRTGPSNGNPAGAASLDFDFERPYGLALLSSPQTTYFQFWYRDVAGGPSGFNLSDAIQIDLAP